MRVITVLLAMLLSSCASKHPLHDLVHGKDQERVVVNVHCHCEEKKETK